MDRALREDNRQPGIIQGGTHPEKPLTQSVCYPKLMHRSSIGIPSSSIHGEIDEKDEKEKKV